jgi:2-hydroxychromene-2-carboxylate isomerase
MKNVDFYFDFVSPFAYLCLHRLAELGDVSLRYRPVLFAGLLNHFGQKGPAEIPAKRLWTYRWCTWWAKDLGVPFRFPDEHPFNPLPYLRLALACDARPDAVKRIFDTLWMSGGNANDAERFSRLCADLKVDQARLAEMKEPLRKNTEEAAARGVFGVPSFVVDGQVFWGADSLDFLGAFLKNPRLFDEPEMKSLDGLPVAASRTG